MLHDASGVEVVKKWLQSLVLLALLSYAVIKNRIVKIVIGIEHSTSQQVVYSHGRSLQIILTI